MNRFHVGVDAAGGKKHFPAPGDAVGKRVLQVVVVLFFLSTRWRLQK